MPNPELDQDLKSTLTPEEVAAAEAPEFTDDDVAAMHNIVGDAVEPHDPEASAAKAAEAAGKTTEPAAAADDEAAGKGADKDAGDEPVAKAAEPERDVPVDVAPTYTADAPEKADEQFADLQTQEGALWKQFDDGEIDRAELQTALAVINDKRSGLNAARLKSEIAAEFTTQNRVARQRATLMQAFADYKTPEQGAIDYMADKEAMAELDASWQILRNRAENAGKSDRWLFDEAHRIVRAMRENVKPVAVKPSAQKRKPELELPKTLANVPGGAGPGDIEGEFAELDKLEGESLEDAIAKMTPDQRQRYELAA